MGRDHQEHISGVGQKEVELEEDRVHRRKVRSMVGLARRDVPFGLVWSLTALHLVDDTL